MKNSSLLIIETHITREKIKDRIFIPERISAKALGIQTTAEAYLRPATELILAAYAHSQNNTQGT